MTLATRTPLALPLGYADWLARLKGQIDEARQSAARAAGPELVKLYRRFEHNNRQP